MHIDLIGFNAFKQITGLIYSSINIYRFAEFELHDMFHGFKMSIWKIMLFHAQLKKKKEKTTDALNVT